MPTKPFYIRQKPPAQSFIQLPSFLFEAPSFCALSNEAKILYAMILRRTELSRKSGWADDYGKIYLYYPINEVCGLLHCGRQKAVDTCGSCNMPIWCPSKTGVWKTQPDIPKTLRGGFTHRLQGIRLKHARGAESRPCKYGNQSS